MCRWCSQVRRNNEITRQCPILKIFVNPQLVAGGDSASNSNGTEEETKDEDSQPSASGGSPESNEIRQRRLEHFQSKLAKREAPH